MSDYLRKRERERQLEKIRGKKKNGNGSARAAASPNPHAVDDLVLYAINDGDLYRSQRQSLEQRLASTWAKGTYSPQTALAWWGSFAADAARKYGREFTGKPSHGGFPMPVIKAAAKELRDRWEAEAELGNF